MLLTLFTCRKWVVGLVAVGVQLVFLSEACAQNAANSVTVAAKVAHNAPVNALAASSASVLPVPRLGGLAQSNPFDPDRKQWQAKVPPPPPPPVPATVTEDDLSIYGIVLAGGVQKVLLKPGKRFESVPVGPTGIAGVYVGSQLGEFVLAQVMPDQILLSAPGGQQWVRVGRKNDRSGTSASIRNPAMPSPVAGAAPTETNQSVSPIQTNPLPQLAGGSDSASSTSGFGGGLAQVTSSPPGSLAAAIAAAQAKQNGQPTPPPAPMVNPFEALLQQQKLGR